MQGERASERGCVENGVEEIGGVDQRDYIADGRVEVGREGGSCVLTVWRTLRISEWEVVGSTVFGILPPLDGQ